MLCFYIALIQFSTSFLKNSGLFTKPSSILMDLNREKFYRTILLLRIVFQMNFNENHASLIGFLKMMYKYINIFDIIFNIRKNYNSTKLFLFLSTIRNTYTQK
jgi:hypothetical protein